MNNLITLEGGIINGHITTSKSSAEIAQMVADKKIVILKNLFPKEHLLDIRKSLIEWESAIETVTTDDFKGNYHSKKIKISNLQKVPHIFHDFNFNDFEQLPSNFKEQMVRVFEPLRKFYCELTGYNVPFGFIENEPYLHPQLIHYPVGGGFFGRHNHNLLPQKVGFILSFSQNGEDFRGGGTVFEIDGEVIDLEAYQDMGDLVLWPNDVDHWVKQSSLEDWFTWDLNKGRIIATLAYFNPY